MATKSNIKLQGHEKFALREGWINKALKIIPENPDAFLRKDATDIFGIGSNMVKSLRYWMRAFGLTNESGSELTEIGNLIADQDPYIEDEFSLWLMHSYIAKNESFATTWFMYFNHCEANELDKNQIKKILLREITKYEPGEKFSEKSLENDVDVLLNMYSKSKDNYNPEDKNVSPFASLGLVKNMDGKYNKCHPSKKKFDEMIVLYELSLLLAGKESISIEEAIDGRNGLNRIYNLSSVMANEIFDRLDAMGYVRVDRTAGLDMIYPVEKLSSLKIVSMHYENR